MHTAHAGHVQRPLCFAINATAVAHDDLYRNCAEVNIEVVRRRCEVGGAMPLVLDGLGTGVFFSRQLLILCDSKGSYLPGPR